jgi:hypothetical protein
MEANKDMAQKKTEQSENEARQLTGYSVEPTGAVALVGTAQFMEALSASVKALSLAPATPENADMCVKGVTKFNKEMKGYQEQIDFLKAEYDRPLNEVIDPRTLAISFDGSPKHKNELFDKAKKFLKERKEEKL